MAAGVLITLDNLGIVDAGDYLRFWLCGARPGGWPQSSPSGA
jgi:hypothetical protein